jgi:hypothetical protein
MWLDGEDIPFSVNTGLRGNLEIAASGNKALHDSILDEMQLSFIKAGLHVGHPFNKNHLMRNLEFQQGTVRENTARNNWVRDRLQQPA